MKVQKVFSVPIALFVLTLVGCGGGGGGGESASQHPLTSAAVGSLKDLIPAARDLIPAGSAFKARLARAAAGRTEPMPVDQLFDWAESMHGDLFPSQELTKVLAPYQYRYYPATNLYVGVANGDVFLLGAKHTGGLVVRVGAVADFATRIAGCDQAARLGAKGEVIFPPEATDVEAPEDVNEDTGSLAALYPSLNTTTDAFYSSLPCEPSIGGTLPPDEEVNKDDVAAEEYIRKFEETVVESLVNPLLTALKPNLPALDSFILGGCFIITPPTAASPGSRKAVDCNSPLLLNAAMPFEGRDIIYVNGLETRHLHERINNPTGPASREWPTNSGEFLNPGGYFRTTAEEYWRAHLIEHLSSAASFTVPVWPHPGGWQWTSADTQPIYVPKANRYMLATWSSNQTIEYAQHAVLTQIHKAMTTGLNVVTPTTYPKDQIRPFCSNGCIVIGHSTGPLITSSAFGRAHAGDFGDGGKQIVSRMLAHVSMDGAMSGSRISTIGYALASGLAPIPSASNVICLIAKELFGTAAACTEDLSFVLTSILRDLIPVVSQGVWGAHVDRSPVPTVTIAGGHPRGNQAGGITQLFLPGVDDGVLTMNSACGNPNLVLPGYIPPSGLTALNPLKAFEFSDWGPRLVRGVKIWASQKNLMMTVPTPGYLAGACTPYLSAAGMVLPVSYDWAGTPFDSRKRYRNHFSFIQSLAEHSYDGGGSPQPSMWPSYYGGPASELRQYAPRNVSVGAEFSGINVEESRAVTDPGIYRTLDANGTMLVKPLDMRVLKRGKTISFRMPWNIGNCMIVGSGLKKYRCTRWVWKRTYHLADKWEKKQSSHYVYEFVARR